MRILLVDDHVLVRQGIARLLADTAGWVVCGEASDGLRAVALARELQPDVIVMDLFLPKLSGVDALRAIKRDLPDVDVIVLTVSDTDEDIYQAVAAGAKGYVIKTTDHTELVRQIQHALAGGVALAPSVAGKLAASLWHRGNSAPNDRSAAPEQLTNREKEVLVHIGQGAHNKDIAAALSISLNTVRSHVGRMMHKLDVDNRAQLAVHAVRLGLITGDITAPPGADRHWRHNMPLAPFAL